MSKYFSRGINNKDLFLHYWNVLWKIVFLLKINIKENDGAHDTNKKRITFLAYVGLNNVIWFIFSSSEIKGFFKNANEGNKISTLMQYNRHYSILQRNLYIVQASYSTTLNLKDFNLTSVTMKRTRLSIIYNVFLWSWNYFIILITSQYYIKYFLCTNHLLTRNHLLMALSQFSIQIPSNYILNKVITYYPSLRNNHRYSWCVYSCIGRKTLKAHWTPYPVMVC